MMESASLVVRQYRGSVRRSNGIYASAPLGLIVVTPAVLRVRGAGPLRSLFDEFVDKSDIDRIEYSRLSGVVIFRRGRNFLAPFSLYGGQEFLCFYSLFPWHNRALLGLLKELGYPVH